MARKTRKTAKRRTKAAPTPAAPKMVTRLLPFKVENDTHIRRHVRGVMVSQELFHTHALNGMLIGMTNVWPARRAKLFMDGLWQTAMEWQPEGVNNLLTGDMLPFYQMAAKAFRECAEANNPIAALTVLRLARAEQMMVRAISRLAPQLATEASDKVALGESKQLRVLQLFKDEPLKVYEASGRQLRGYVHEAHWYYGELLNMPYALQTDLLFPAQVIFAKCVTLDDLNGMLSGENVRDFRTLEDARAALKADRYAYLMRQTQAAAVVLSDMCGTQNGMSHVDAHRVLNGVYPNMKGQNQAA